MPSPHTITFDRPTASRAKRYLLRLINTSFESTFVFSIDNHLLQIVGADFVPIHPYMNTSVLVGIGQRYHVIVTADPISNPGSPIAGDGNYWIRTWRSDCFLPQNHQNGSEKSGILRYNGSSEALPTSNTWGPNPYGNISLRCSDETYSSLEPILPWTVGPAANAPSDKIGESFTVQSDFGPKNIFPLALFSMGGDDFNPLQTEYGNPTFLKLAFSGKRNPLSVVIPENFTDTDWVSGLRYVSQSVFSAC